jgi:putative hydrolase of the HAD superfamily
MITTLLFDLDNTLYDQWSFYIQAHKAVSDYVGKSFKKNSQKIYKNALEILQKRGSEYGHIYDDILKEEKIYSKKTLDEIINYYRNFKPKIRLYPDFEKILSILRQKYKLGIITDGVPQVQKNKCKSLGIFKKIPLIIFTRELGMENEKPSSLPYKIALKKLKSKASETIYIADNPVRDFVGAKILNMKTIRIIRGEYKNIKETIPNDVDFVINNYNKKFLKLIENL